jgi:hypothetical protein
MDFVTIAIAITLVLAIIGAFQVGKWTGTLFGEAQTPDEDA